MVGGVLGEDAGLGKGCGGYWMWVIRVSFRGGGVRVRGNRVARRLVFKVGEG